MKMRGLLISAFAVAIFAASGVAGYQHVRATGAGWREIAWPFPRDGWPAGRAFRCETEVCGSEVEVYLRPEIGFCNCDTGVADDDEVDRVADLDLISERFVPLREGEVIRVADMQGRLRTYDLHLTGGVRHSAIGIAVSRGCDLMVAVAQGTGAAPDVQRVALDFLASRDITRWMTKAMDGG
ncbi:MAG: hypothetical protein E8A46_16215 [Bradyrhizobium sp.]|jgi:hypothetical protein|uniref:hypothetical protein n=1 Tax=Bradyrhizobium sp. TaxID=376 RepID=UPI001215D7C8|nr:hypothetical protein [Bradyrhizobium sp.]THD51174.1 MAG: hypothetical protein E8A46_16215 [Bradyrhizobium sp.]